MKTINSITTICLIILVSFILFVENRCFANQQVFYPQIIEISQVQGIDDYSAIIQEAFDKKPKRILFTAGNYSFSNVVIKDNVVIEAKGVVVFHPISVPQALEKTGLNMYQSMFVANDVDSVTIKDVKFVGETTNTIIESSFKTTTYFSRPVIFINKAKYVHVSGCYFNNIEGCSCCSKSYTYYGNKKGLLLCLYDVDDFWFVNNEITSCRHDEQVWSIAVEKERKNLAVHFVNNYIHDEEPSTNSSVFSCVAGKVYVTNNLIERFHYKGSIFNLFGEVVYAENNTVKDSYATSVFDVSEYGYFFADSVFVRNNNISAQNSQMVAAYANYIECSENVFEGVSLLVSENHPVASKSRYRYFYQKESPRFANSNVIVARNRCVFTNYNPSLSILWPERYACGIFIMPYYNVGSKVSIRNNEFTSFSVGSSGDNIPSFNCNTIKIFNMNDIVVDGNTIKGAWYHPGSTTYTTPIVVGMEVRNFPTSLNSLDSFLTIQSVNITNNTLEPNSPNSTVLSVSSRFAEKSLRIDKLLVKDNDGIIGPPMLYDSFVDEVMYKGSNNSVVSLPCRKLNSHRIKDKMKRRVDRIQEGERLENGSLIRLKDNSVWCSTNVVTSFNHSDTKMKRISQDEMSFQGVYWIRVKR